MHEIFSGSTGHPGLDHRPRRRRGAAGARAGRAAACHVIEVTLRTSLPPSAIIAPRACPTPWSAPARCCAAADVARALEAGAQFLVSPGLDAGARGGRRWRASFPIFRASRRRPR